MPITDYEPTVQDVADLLLAYTKGKFSEEGTFNANTSPTAEVVERMIARVAAGLGVRIGPDLPYADAEPDTIEARMRDTLVIASKDLVSLIVAARIARSLRPEQMDASNRNVAASLSEEANATSKILLEGINEALGGSGEAGGSVAVPDTAGGVGSFPEDAGGMIGWGTRF